MIIQAKKVKLKGMAPLIVLAESFSSNDNEAILCCPVCGFNYVHIGAVEVRQGKTMAVSAGDRTEVLGNDRPWNKGSQITINLWCENYHGFSYTLKFHKGNTTLALVAGDAPFPNKSLWRS